MNKFRKVVYICIFAALIFGAAYFFHSKSNKQVTQSYALEIKLPDEHETAKESRTFETANSSTKLSISKSVQAAKQATFNTAVAKLLSTELSTSKDLKAFYNKYKNDGSPEGKIYFAKAMDGCGIFVDVINNKWDTNPEIHGIIPSHPDYLNRLQAFKELTSRCEGFFSTDAKQFWTEFRAAHENANKDPGALMSAALATNKLFSKNGVIDEDGFKDAALLAQKVLASKDPDAIAQLGGFFHVYWDHKDFKNTNMDRDRDQPYLRIGAFTLAACELGQDCSKNSLQAVYGCIYSIEQCQGLNSIASSNLTTEQKNLLEQYKQELLQAINSGDYRQLGLPTK